MVSVRALSYLDCSEVHKCQMDEILTKFPGVHSAVRSQLLRHMMRQVGGWAGGCLQMPRRDEGVRET